MSKVDREHLMGRCPTWSQERRENRSCPTGNSSRWNPRKSSPSCDGLAGSRPTTVLSRRGSTTTTTTAFIGFLYYWLLFLFVAIHNTLNKFIGANNGGHSHDTYSVTVRGLAHTAATVQLAHPHSNNPLGPIPAVSAYTHAS